MNAIQPAIWCKELEIGYQQGHPLFRNLNFSVVKGQVTCLMGPNGVGKSTLIKTVLGILAPISGQLYLSGRPISEIGKEEIARMVSVVYTDRIVRGNIRVQEMVALGRIPHTGWLGSLSKNDLLSIHTALEDVNIAESSNAPLAELSDGQLQKALIARALAQDGDLLILDEPTAHLDLVNRFEIMYLLRELAIKKDKAVFVVTHDLDIALETADRLLLMTDKGTLHAGTPEDLVINGGINQLFPDGRYFFDPKTSKVVKTQDYEPITISGPEVLTVWIHKILRKYGVNATPYSIEVSDNPFQISLRSEKQTLQLETLEQMIDHLLRK
ncbi:ABC transporter-like protein [Lunatimonas lonarensis]|uniref:ABC transporter-like protein n=1 Tax=Lunatimonas lonarensis TaxID=1232681 RepID=R7ZZC4_9BACT|nr:ABC transporter ATP-binding protein [Lunatimonas lonarensis]EON79403.1 ABC transporter-like protein [Lunatimonas lonarensis]